MNKPILILVLVASLTLVAAAALAFPQGPGYGQDPTAEPPREGVGNANSGNHEMHLNNYRNRWSYGNGTTEEDAVAAPRPERVFEPASCLLYEGIFVWNRFMGPVILR